MTAKIFRGKSSEDEGKRGETQEASEVENACMLRVVTRHQSVRNMYSIYGIYIGI